MKVTTRIETIFAHAVAMDNRGMKNMIHCIGSNIFIVNFDYSMMLRFSLRKSETVFASPISFNANDYESPDFTWSEKDGEIIFHTQAKEYERKKICRGNATGPNATEIRKTYHRLKHEGEESPLLFNLSNECCGLLDEELSHVEISAEDSTLILRQRNVYTGTMVEVSKKDDGLISVDQLPKSMGPFAMRTQDFLSLFLIHRSLVFIPTEDFILVKDQKEDFDGVISLCRYDMIINLHDDGKERDHGRQEQKARPGESSIDRPAETAARFHRTNKQEG